MISQLEFDKEIDLIIANAIREDIGDGDHTSLACIPKTAHGKAKLMVKEAGIIAGVNFAKHVFNYVDSSLSINIIINEGVFVNEGDIVFYVEGASQSILRAERLVLNGMQRMSAIATKTNVFVNLLHGTKTKILDTRKTTPGIRALEKWAVSIGGGENHRFGLFDMIMLKDNHIDFCGSITKAIINTQQYLKNTNKEFKIIVEARSLGEIEEILRCEGVFRILIDNFSVTDTVKAVKMIGNKCLTESSGNIDETTVRKYAECGVNYISSGALTHSVHNMDLSLKAI